MVDFIEGFTSIQSPFGGPWDEAIAHTAELLRHARRSNVPAIFTTVEFDPQDLEKNLLISKKHGSAFLGTDLAARLEAMQIDTLLIAGCVTSGCVRASAVDAAQYGFRPLVVRETVGDRSPLAHEANLLDIAARYGDVVSMEQARECLETHVSGRSSLALASGDSLAKSAKIAKIAKGEL